jgi:hypothetical protein
MNVLFHLSVGVGIISTFSNNKTISAKHIFAGGILGVLSHGILDYIPHCYPINSKVDALVGLSFLIGFLLLVKNKWRLLSVVVLVGCILPDLIDLGPTIVNKLLNFNIFPEFNNFFPWHYHDYSGSIYNQVCSVSNVNHFLTLLFSGTLVFLNIDCFRRIFRF